MVRRWSAGRNPADQKAGAPGSRIRTRNRNRGRFRVRNRSRNRNRPRRRIRDRGHDPVRCPCMITSGLFMKSRIVGEMTQVKGKTSRLEGDP